MNRCIDFPACGHGPASTGGDGGGCPDEDGRYQCVLCAAKLEKGARSSICAGCRSLSSAQHEEMGHYDLTGQDEERDDY